MPSTEILSMAILEPVTGKEEECLEFLRDFYTLLDQKQYSRDLLFRDQKTPGKFIHLRIWRSEETRHEAQQDPDVHHFWLRLPEVCNITTIYETLESLFSTYDKIPM